MADPAHAGEYTPRLLDVLQRLWGDGFLSPGGEKHLAAIVSGIDRVDKRVLDVGSAGQLARAAASSRRSHSVNRLGLGSITE